MRLHFLHLREIMSKYKKQKYVTLQKTIKRLARQYFIEKTNREYEELKKNTKAWQDHQEEIKEWDITLSDELKDEYII